MTVGELKKIIKDLPDDMSVEVPSYQDGDYKVDASAYVGEYADGRKYLCITER